MPNEKPPRPPARYTKHIDATVTPEQLVELDQEAAAQGTSRRALLRRYLTQGLAMDARHRKELAGE